jgi:hypothetical protein
MPPAQFSLHLDPGVRLHADEHVGDCAHVWPPSQLSPPQARWRSQGSGLARAENRRNRTSEFGLTDGGTAGLVWGYLIVWAGYMLVFASIAEMASMYVSRGRVPPSPLSLSLLLPWPRSRLMACARAPTSGGQYHWVSEFAPRSTQKVVSYVVGKASFFSGAPSPGPCSFLSDRRASHHLQAGPPCWDGRRASRLSPFWSGP